MSDQIAKSETRSARSAPRCCSRTSTSGSGRSSCRPRDTSRCTNISTPYLIVPISSGRSVMKWPDGRERQLTDVPGDIKYREAAGGPHELFNLEDTDFHCVLVEIKVGGKAS